MYTSTVRRPAIAQNQSREPRLRHGSLVIALVLACFALSPALHAVTPEPDGGYPGHNTAEGTDALFSRTTGDDNTAIGFDALLNLTIGSENTAIGSGALRKNDGIRNTAIGCQALLNNTTGVNNTAIGFDALFNNMGGFVTGLNNTATGTFALLNNTIGVGNTANGVFALGSNISGSNNTANGINSLFHNAASNNTATGFNALYNNTIGYDDTADGTGALFHNTSGTLNVAMGYQAGLNLTTGSGNVCVGANVFGVAGESNTTRIRNIYTSIASGRAVYVNSDNKIGTLSSSRRFKEEIKPMDEASEALFALKPVTFRYKEGVDPARMLSFGLIAEDVAKVNSDLVTRDERGDPQSVRYEAVNAMLLNEFLKEHGKVEEQGRDLQGQKAINAELRSTIAQQQKDIRALAQQVEKVSAQIATSRVAPHVVANR